MKDKILQPLVAVLGGIFGFIYGDITGMMWALIAMIVLDYITGVIVASVNKTLSSKIGAKGIAKKVIILLIVAVAHIIDIVIGGGNTAVIMTATECFYIANEGISILENAGNIGLPLPKKIKSILIQIKKESEDK